MKFGILLRSSKDLIAFNLSLLSALFALIGSLLLIEFCSSVDSEAKITRRRNDDLCEQF